MKVCECHPPKDLTDPRMENVCRQCRGQIVLSEWASSDRNHGEFFERLALAMFPAYASTLDRKMIPRWFYDFYRHCSHREKAGRRKFGLKYLSYDNAEYQEEMADGGNYAFFSLCRDRREGRGDEEIDRRLSQAKNAALGWKDAYEENRRISHPFSDPDTETPADTTMTPHN